jgi:hypothetical protein
MMVKASLSVDLIVVAFGAFIILTMGGIYRIYRNQ